METSKIGQLREKFRSELLNSTDSADLVCENNRNDTVPCPNGFCQLINDGDSGFARHCIPKGFSYFSPSIFIGSSMMEQFDNKSAFMYICNQPMCNNLITAEKIHSSLAQLGLLTPFHTQPTTTTATTTTTTTTAITTTSTSKTIRILPQIMIGLQCILFLAMVIFI